MCYSTQHQYNSENTPKTNLKTGYNIEKYEYKQKLQINGSQWTTFKDA